MGRTLLSVPLSMFRWPELGLANLTGSFLDFSGLIPSWRWAGLRWPGLDFSVVDDVLWSLVTAFESVALVAMLCFFFLCCGCTV